MSDKMNVAGIPVSVLNCLAIVIAFSEKSTPVAIAPNFPHEPLQGRLVREGGRRPHVAAVGGHHRAG